MKKFLIAAFVLIIICLFVSSCTGYNISLLDDDDSYDNPDDPPPAEDPPYTLSVVDPGTLDLGDNIDEPAPPPVKGEDTKYYALNKPGFYEAGTTVDAINGLTGEVIRSFHLGLESATMTGMRDEFALVFLDRNGSHDDINMAQLDGRILGPLVELGTNVREEGKIHYARNADTMITASEYEVYFTDLYSDVVGVTWVLEEEDFEHCWLDATSDPNPYGDPTIYLLDAMGRAIHEYDTATRHLSPTPVVTGLTDSSVLGIDYEGNLYTGSDSPVLAIISAIDRIPMYMSIPEIYRTIAIEPASENSVYLLYSTSDASKGGTTLERVWSDGTREEIFNILDAPWVDFIPM